MAEDTVARWSVWTCLGQSLLLSMTLLTSGFIVKAEASEPFVFQQTLAGGVNERTPDHLTYFITQPISDPALVGEVDIAFITVNLDVTFQAYRPGYATPPCVSFDIALGPGGDAPFGSAVGQLSTSVFPSFSNPDEGLDIPVDFCPTTDPLPSTGQYGATIYLTATAATGPPGISGSGGGVAPATFGLGFDSSYAFSHTTFRPPGGLVAQLRFGNDEGIVPGDLGFKFTVSQVFISISGDFTPSPSTTTPTSSTTSTTSTLPPSTLPQCRGRVCRKRVRHLRHDCVRVCRGTSGGGAMGQRCIRACRQDITVPFCETSGACNRTGFNRVGPFERVGLGPPPAGKLPVGVRFFNASGYSISSPVVGIGDIEVLAPPYFDLRRGALSTGIVAIELQYTDGSTQPVDAGLYVIAEPPDVSLPPGQLTWAFTQTAQRFAVAANSSLAAVDALTSSERAAALHGVLTTSASKLPVIGSVTAAASGRRPVRLAEVGHVTATLNVRGLRTTDRILAAALRALVASHQSGALARGRGAPVASPTSRPEGIWSTAFTDVQLAAGVRSLTLSPQDTSDPCTDLGDTGLVYCASNITPEEEFRDSILRDGEIFTAVGGAVTSGLALAGAITGEAGLTAAVAGTLGPLLVVGCAVLPVVIAFDVTATAEIARGEAPSLEGHVEELRYLASVAFDYVLAKLGESAVKEATDTGSIGEAVFVVANTVLNYTKDLGKTLADVLGPTTTTSTTLPHPDGGCCVQNNGCPGETPNSCANTAGCCCCPEGQTCCADHALGCCG